MFGAKGRPHRKNKDLSPRQGIVIETPRWDLTIFKVHFGLLTLKAYSKGEHVLRFEAVVHNTRQLGTGRVLDRFPDIVGRLRAMVDRFLTMLDCVDVGFIADGTLDNLPVPSAIGTGRLGGIDLNKPRARAVMATAVALSVAPTGSPSPTSPPKPTPWVPSPAPTTPSAKRLTTSESSVENTSS